MIDGILRYHLRPESRYLFGFADMSGLLDDKFHGYRYAISIGRGLDYSIVDRIKDGPTPEYYAHYRDVNTELADIASKVAVDIRKLQTDVIAIPPSVSTAELDTTYRDTLRTDLSHKMVATRAGLGWIGKTDLLITKKFGPRLRLTSLLLKEIPGKVSSPVNKSKCGSCAICVEACPATAANGRNWDVTVDRDEIYDAWKCRNQCVEFGLSRLSANARVCGICVAVCPIGQ